MKCLLNEISLYEQTYQSLEKIYDPKKLFPELYALMQQINQKIAISKEWFNTEKQFSVEQTSLFLELQMELISFKKEFQSAVRKLNELYMALTSTPEIKQISMEDLLNGDNVQEEEQSICASEVVSVFITEPTFDKAVQTEEMEGIIEIMGENDDSFILINQ